MDFVVTRRLTKLLVWIVEAASSRFESRGWKPLLGFQMRQLFTCRTINARSLAVGKWQLAHGVAPRQVKAARTRRSPKRLFRSHRRLETTKPPGEDAGLYISVLSVPSAASRRGKSPLSPFDKLRTSSGPSTSLRTSRNRSALSVVKTSNQWSVVSHQ